MVRYIVINKIIAGSGEVLKVEHTQTYKTLEEAARLQLEHMNDSDYVYVGFKIVELHS